MLHISRRRESDDASGDLSSEWTKMASSNKEDKETKRIRGIVADVISGLLIPVTKSGAAAGGVGQPPGSSGASDVNTTTTEQQIFMMTKEIGAIQQAALQVWDLGPIKYE